jgi:hypothetical protein
VVRRETLVLLGWAAVFLVPPILYLTGGSVHYTCQIGDVTTSDDYLCSLNGTPVTSPWLAIPMAFLLWFAVVVGVVSVFQQSGKKKK